MQENIPESVKITAKNIHELLLKLASHIEKLEQENKELKQKLSSHNDDMK